MFQSIRSFVVHDGSRSCHHVFRILLWYCCIFPHCTHYTAVGHTLADVINKLLGNSSWPIILLGDHGCKLTRLRASPLICNSWRQESDVPFLITMRSSLRSPTRSRLLQSLLSYALRGLLVAAQGNSRRGGVVLAEETLGMGGMTEGLICG